MIIPEGRNYYYGHTCPGNGNGINYVYDKLIGGRILKECICKSHTIQLTPDYHQSGKRKRERPATRTTKKQTSTGFPRPRPWIAPSKPPLVARFSKYFRQLQYPVVLRHATMI